MQATTKTPKVTGDFPGQQRVRFAASQRAALAAELRELRQRERQHIAEVRRGMKGSPVPAARERIFALDRALAQVESFAEPGRPFELVAPVWLVRSVVFCAADHAVYLLSEEVAEMRDGRGSRRRVRERAYPAESWTRTLLAVSRRGGDL